MDHQREVDSTIHHGSRSYSQYTGKADSWKKKLVSKKPTFLTKEEQEAKRWFEARKDWVIKHKEESIAEHYTSLKQQAYWCNMLKLPPRAILTRSIFNSTKLPHPEV